MNNRISILSFVALCLALVVCGKKQPEQAPAAQVAFEADSLLPLRAGNYSLATRTAKQTPEEVASFLGDEIAARMGRYALVGLAAGIYEGGPHALTVQISQFAEPIDALGYYSLDRPDGADTSGLGTEGYVSGFSFTFTQSNFVVKLSTAGLSDTTLSLVLPVAVTISAAIGSSPPPPEEFTLFPRKDMVVPSNRYYAEDFMEINDLRAVFTVDYVVNGDSLTLFLADDGLGSKFAALMQATGESPKSAPAPESFVFDDGYNLLITREPYGAVLAGLKKGYLIGALKYHPQKHAAFVADWINTFAGIVGQR